MSNFLIYSKDLYSQSELDSSKILKEIYDWYKVSNNPDVYYKINKYSGFDIYFNKINEKDVIKLDVISLLGSGTIAKILSKVLNKNLISSLKYSSNTNIIPDPNDSIIIAVIKGPSIKEDSKFLSLNNSLEFIKISFSHKQE